MKSLLLILLLLALGTLAWRGLLPATNFLNARALPPSYRSPGNIKAKRADHGLLAGKYAKEHHLNTHFCFLVDMSLPSGTNRFFIYDLDNDLSQEGSLVTHGRCNEQWLEGRKYGNTVGCGCTSLGRYSVGKPYQGRFGLAYKLYGLDSSNNNAFNRFVVLHSHECVPASEIYPREICQSDGCPTVSPAFLKKLANKIDRSGKPILLWIYE